MEDQNTENKEEKKDIGYYFNLKEVLFYYFRKKDPNRPTNTNLKMMHGINKISMLLFLICLIVIISRFIIRAFQKGVVDIESYRSYCISKPGVTEGFPFDEKTLVFKVMGKMFALADVDEFLSITLKCDAKEAIKLREQYDGSILPGYHMNKNYWNTVMMDGRVPDAKIQHLINHSYEQVVAGLPNKMKEELKNS